MPRFSENSLALLVIVAIFYPAPVVGLHMAPLQCAADTAQIRDV